MIQTQRTSTTRVLKQRDVQSGEVVRPALAPIDAALARVASTPAAQPNRCAAKEARLVATEGGAQAVEVRCSCGEWTRVELQVESLKQESR